MYTRAGGTRAGARGVQIRQESRNHVSIMFHTYAPERDLLTQPGHSQGNGFRARPQLRSRSGLQESAQERVRGTGVSVATKA